MEVQLAMLSSWLTAVDFAQEYGQGTEPETPVFVDVGGGSGHQCAELRSALPNVKGRVILQDTPAVLAHAISGPDVERMEYDYFTEQPVKGAYPTQEIVLSETERARWRGETDFI